MVEIKAREKLENLGKKVVQKIKQGENPYIDVPIRALSNVDYNQKTQKLQLGDKSAKRFFLNVAHAKKFLQTFEVASIAHDLLDKKKQTQAMRYLERLDKLAGESKKL